MEKSHVPTISVEVIPLNPMKNRQGLPPSIQCGAPQVAGKNTYYVARRVFRKNLPTLRQKKQIFPHTLLKDMLYTALSPDQPPQWPSPPTPTDGSCSWHVLSSCIFSPYTHRSNSHLAYEIPSCICALHSYVHPYISCSSLSLCHRSFLLVFLCIGTHITGRIVFPIRIQFSISPPLPTVLSQ